MRETVVTFNDIERAYATVKTVVHKAPLLTSWIFNEWSSSNVYCPNNTRSRLVSDSLGHLDGSPSAGSASRGNRDHHIPCGSTERVWRK